jgi:AcrR family transcriptional regulator
MPGKAARTTAYITKTIAPIFNKHGYLGTSLSELTKATNLTKGALYGNFANKEALAMAAFNYNAQLLLEALDAKLDFPGSVTQKLSAITDFYRHYHETSAPWGGCPIVNIGVDANGNNENLQKACTDLVKKVEQRIASVLDKGVKNGELHLPVPPLQFAKQFFTMIQGGVTMTTVTGDRKYLTNTMAYLDQLVAKEIKK